MGKFVYMLAPMEDITSNAFRSNCHSLGADVTFTELVRLAGLAKHDENTWHRINMMDDTPTVIQLLGEKEAQLKRFMAEFTPQKGFVGFNLNCGCPNPVAVAQGEGAALITRIAKVKKLIAIIRKTGHPVSVKMRLGITRQDKEKGAYLKLIDAVDADFFVVHARIAQQGYDEPADQTVYEGCVQTGKRIIANGDICTREQVIELKEAGVQGAMIGRAAVCDPGIFARLKGTASPSAAEITKSYLTLAERFGEPYRYRKNVQKRMGNSGSEQQ